MADEATFRKCFMVEVGDFTTTGTASLIQFLFDSIHR